jgi:CRP/FNR family transcriptional regulator, dissimilatory nitrate respiration regulator
MESHLNQDGVPMTQTAQVECTTTGWGPMNFSDVLINQEFQKPRSSSLDCLKSVSIFSNLSNTEVARFQNAAQTRTHKKGKVLYVEGEYAEYFYVITSGWVKLFHTMPEGEEIIIDTLTKGNLVGESAVFERGYHTNSAQVMEDVQLLCIPMYMLKQQIACSNTLALSMLSAMSQHYRRHCGEMALNRMQSAPQRIGCFLLKHCPKDKKQEIVFHLPYDKTMIANTLGMKIETFSRALNILRNKTGLRIKGKSVEIGSTEQLTKFVYGAFIANYINEGA